MAKKSRKIKHYKRSFSGAGSHSGQIRRVAGWALAILILFGLGWLVAKPGIDLASGLWYSYKNKEETPPASSQASEPTSLPEDTVTGDPAAVEQESVSGWAVVSMTAVATPEKAAETAAQLAEKGIKAALITLKDETGAVYYRSGVALAQSAVADTAFDGAAVAKAFADAGVTPIAGLWAFRDAMAPYADRTAAVKYQDTDYNWLDNSKELGGKPWLNPNSPAAQSYIKDLIQEVGGMGYQKTVVFGLQFPTGFSLESCGYGSLSKSKNALLTEIGKQYEAIKETEVWFCFDQAALAGDNVTAYGASPAEFGLGRILVRGQTTSSTNAEGEQQVTLPATDTVALGTLLSAMQSAGTQTAGYYLFGSDENSTGEANKNAVSAGYTAFVQYS